ncbi:MAG TPA: TRAP transporter large permease subunit [Paracoccaceae bacterium]|nr:TRAP transporter large permease subunit [Paracoccaceae bacterium]
MNLVIGSAFHANIGKRLVKSPMGAIYPGLLRAGLYFLYLAIVAIFSPEKMPSPAQSARTPFWPAFWALVRDLLVPFLLIFSVLGTIIAGIATPTESAAIGAAGALLLALVSGGLNWGTLRQSLYDTTKTTAMIVFVMIGATIFSLVFRQLGGDRMIAGLFNIEESNPYLILFIIMLLIFILGFFLDWVEITLVVGPDCRADRCSARFRASVRPSDDLVCDRPRRQPPDIFPYAALWICTLLPPRGRTGSAAKIEKPWRSAKAKPVRWLSSVSGTAGRSAWIMARKARSSGQDRPILRRATAAVSFSTCTLMIASPVRMISSAQSAFAASAEAR